MEFELTHYEPSYTPDPGVTLTRVESEQYQEDITTPTGPVTYGAVDIPEA